MSILAELQQALADAILREILRENGFLDLLEDTTILKKMKKMSGNVEISRCQDIWTFPVCLCSHMVLRF